VTEEWTIEQILGEQMPHLTTLYGRKLKLVVDNYTVNHKKT